MQKPMFNITPCPVCGRDCETIYTDSDNNVVGCENCYMDGITVWDSAEFLKLEEENKQFDKIYQEFKEK